VVTYDVDGNREGVIDGQTGFLVPPFDRNRLSWALRVLISDPAKRQSMGEAGRDFAIARFDAKVMVEGLEAVYRDAIS
jgi:glycosyltransferase involved in cell wall biosynthesis